MNKKTTGILAGTAGAALLIGGGTFALWNDAETVAGGTITTGNLDIQQIEGGWTWEDVSADRSDNPHEIVLDEHQIVPGDTITGTIEFSAALQGDNLVAELGGDFGAVTVDPAGTDAALLDLIEADVVLEFSADGTNWTEIADGLVTSEENPEAGALPQLPATVSGVANVRAVVTVTFSEDATDRELTQIAGSFGESTLELTQVRAGGGGF